MGPSICLYYGVHYRGKVWCEHGGGGLAKSIGLDTWLIGSGILGYVATASLMIELVAASQQRMGVFACTLAFLMGVQGARLVWLFWGALMFLSDCQQAHPRIIRYLMWAILIGEVINLLNGERVRTR